MKMPPMEAIPSACRTCEGFHEGIYFPYCSSWNTTFHYLRFLKYPYERIKGGNCPKEVKDPER
jgi:hypothetical protein